MSLSEKPFGKGKKTDHRILELKWIEPQDNPWHIRLLDLRPITQGMISTSPDPQMASNAVSYNNEDGRLFLAQPPESPEQISTNISFRVDPILAPGVLFVPNVMENKWALFYHDNMIIFVRSWLRKVVVTANTEQLDGRIIINQINGVFSKDDSPLFTQAAVKYLLISHALDEIYPAPLPSQFESDVQTAGMWAMSHFGNMAHVGTFDRTFEGASHSPVRSLSLLHIAAAKADLAEIDRQLDHGIPIDLYTANGLTPLHRSIYDESTASMRHLLAIGASIDARSEEGATPMMNAVQSNKLAHLQLLIDSGADVNARDNRGFTPLHRAAEMGRTNALKLLLSHHANPTVKAEGYTALSLAEIRGEKEATDILKNF
jgi:hypothetical protein